MNSASAFERILVAHEGSFRRRLLSGLLIMLLLAFHIVYFQIFPSIPSILLNNKELILYGFVIFYVIGAIFDSLFRTFLIYFAHLPILLLVIFFAVPFIFIYYCIIKRRIVRLSAVCVLAISAINPRIADARSSKVFLRAALSTPALKFLDTLDSQAKRNIYRYIGSNQNPSINILLGRLSISYRSIIAANDRNFLEIFNIFQIIFIYLFIFLLELRPALIEIDGNLGIGSISGNENPFIFYLSLFITYFIYMRIFRKYLRLHFDRKVISIFEGLVAKERFQQA